MARGQPPPQLPQREAPPQAGPIAEGVCAGSEFRVGLSHSGNALRRRVSRERRISEIRPWKASLEGFREQVLPALVLESPGVTWKWPCPPGSVGPPRAPMRRSGSGSVVRRRGKPGFLGYGLRITLGLQKPRSVSN